MEKNNRYRYQKIRDVILCHPEATAADVAGRVAPHWNQRRLCNFLRKYYHTNFTTLSPHFSH